MTRDKGISLYRKAKGIIPGGTQLLSKRPEMFVPDGWPSYYARCHGIRVWDLDGNEYRDMTIAGVGACPLGYGDPDVDAAVAEAIKGGNMCTLNAPEEVELSETMIRLHPWAEMVRLARTGGEAMAVSVRIARAATGRDTVLFCGYHGHCDWYLSANLADDSALDGHLLPGLEPAGVPRALRGTAVPFSYNDLRSLEELLHRHKGQAGAVVMEPVRNIWPEKGFLEGVRELTRENGVPLIFDEVTSGFRMNTGGIHLKLGVEPDVAVFAKALGNGYPIAAVIGKEWVMGAAARSFISSTYWTDRIGPSAALATIKKHGRADAGAHLTAIGQAVQDGWRGLAQKHGLQMHISGIPPLSHWSIDCAESGLLHTAISAGMLDRGFLTSKAFYATLAHTQEDVSDYIKALDEVIAGLLPHVKAGDLKEAYPGQAAHTGFKRLT